jgi:hypothetical protein
VLNLTLSSITKPSRPKAIFRDGCLRVAALFGPHAMSEFSRECRQSGRPPTALN